MIRLSIYISLGFVVTSCSIGKLTRLGVYQEVNADQYISYVNDSTVNIIDVRTEAEYEKSHICGAVNANYFGGHFMEELHSLKLDTTKTTLIYCETQHRSLFVAKKLYNAGFHNVIDLDKGMRYWKKIGFPISVNLR
ncbi:MAG: rhodanese-like domain-containing protein [Crocinitomicaceae bacterium]|nr:rhodanese-like domain-containing protein [Crocinitomicaceae bacterium]